jgi:magnesium transporter
MEVLRLEDKIEIIDRLLQQKEYFALKEGLSEIHEADLAEMFDEFSPEECVVLFRLLYKDKAAEVFSHLGASRRADIAMSIRENRLRDILDELYFDDKIDFLEEMPANFVKSLLQNTQAEERAMINQFLRYPENSAGSLMTIEYVDLKRYMTVEQALLRIRTLGNDSEIIYYCYVLDSTRRLQGICSLRHLVLAEDGATIEDLMDDDIVFCQVNDDQEGVAEKFKKYDLMALPVVDGEDRLIGIITIDDIIDVIEQENTEDFQRMAAIAPSDKEYLQTGVVRLAKNRIPWLLILMISAMFSGAIMEFYEETLSAVVALAFFIPLLMDTGGNTGSQSATLVIRGMALGQIDKSDWTMILWKELRVGLIAGSALVTVNALRMMLFGHADMALILTVNGTLLLTLVLAKLIGGMLPIIAKVIKVDPAIMAAPLITTIMDAMSLFIYFGLATILIFR